MHQNPIGQLGQHNPRRGGGLFLNSRRQNGCAQMMQRGQARGDLAQGWLGVQEQEGQVYDTTTDEVPAAKADTLANQQGE